MAINEIANPATIELEKMLGNVECLEPEQDDRVYDMIALVIAENDRLMGRIKYEFAVRVHRRKAYLDGRTVA